ncbi:MAG: L-threonylcarbamoyladenylate synthase [Rhodocyclaceae bacterium]|nr:L-threonylcarbamoyladenylate synthase [Rhodocyclaceae bacterium]
MTEPLEQEILRAAALLRAGELVAFPTETVYGLGADARNPQAVAKIFAVKGRPADHPLIVHLRGAEQLAYWARDIPAEASLLAEKFWPGPLTLILKRTASVPDIVTGGQDTVGLRVPNHPVALALLAAFGDGIAAPSANKFGRISPTTAQHVREDLGDAVPLVLDGGPCAVGIESTILDLTTRRAVILRPGMITAFELGRVLGRNPLFADDPLAPEEVRRRRASGRLVAHYAPRTPLVLTPDDSLPIVLRNALARQERVAVLARHPAPADWPHIVWRVAPDDPAGFAHELYAHLRALDALGCRRIYVQKPIGPAWRAVLDRLERAAAGSGEQTP